MQFRFPDIDRISFWIGVLIATVFWWIVAAIRPLFAQALQNLKVKRKEKKEKSRRANPIEERYRQMILQQAQGLHLAAALFSLDEILMPPALLVPPARLASGAFASTEDILHLAVPYLPGWPELAAIYNAPTMPLSQALSGGSDLVLVGHPGCGKTVALAQLASQVARREPSSGLPIDSLPFLFHVADLDLPLKNPPSRRCPEFIEGCCAEALLNPIIEMLAERAALIDLSRLPDFIRQAFSEGRALFLLDGLDELPPEEIKAAADYLNQLKQSYPATRLVTTACPECLDGLLDLNFVPFSLAAWNSRQRAEFLDKWSELWSRYVAVEGWAQPVEPLLLNSWLNADKITPTPLELTLQAWAAYAGDVRGLRPLDGIQAHIRRLTPADTPAATLELLALQINLALKPVFDPRQAREWIKSYDAPLGYEPAESDTSDETSEPGKSRQARRVGVALSLSKGAAHKQEKAVSKPGVLEKMAASGMLSQHRKDQMRFTHPIFAGFLGGKALVNYRTETTLEQPNWSGKQLALLYLAAHSDVTALAESLTATPERPLEGKLLTVARWLRQSPGQLPWRGQVMAKLAGLLQEYDLPLALRGQALAALVQSQDPGAAALFRQLFKAASPEVIQLAALGSGAIQDSKAVEDLADLLNNPSPNVQRAACLGLTAIGTTPAIDCVGSALLHGNESLRRYAAEALTNHPQDGHAMLKEGATVDDLLVRHAVVYGLGRVGQPWADELLAKMQVEDKEWIVRASATEVLENRQLARAYLPSPLPPPSESPWLIAFAGKQGMGISPDKPATDLLLMALKNGSEEERISSLAYLRQRPNEKVLSALYQGMYGGDAALREVIFQVLSELEASGVPLPDPRQFGVG
ncbi:MAG: HEAT repeat domain-containing protein [Chloroflexi bacterium]|nr:HEAT repeat domain-containing protein [Chloroflexota bacterium]